MTRTAELSTDESECDIPDRLTEEAPDRLTENDAVANCVRAWRITMKNERAELDEGDSEFEAEKVANDAYLGAMPPLPATATFATSSPASPRLPCWM